MEYDMPERQTLGHWVDAEITLHDLVFMFRRDIAGVWANLNPAPYTIPAGEVLGSMIHGILTILKTRGIFRQALGFRRHEGG